jgi:predicted amino acid dehydrogenase
MDDLSRRHAVTNAAALAARSIMHLLEEHGVSINDTQAAAIGAGMGQIAMAQMQELQVNAGGRCCVCDCPMSNPRCGHSCCCVV